MKYIKLFEEAGSNIIECKVTFNNKLTTSKLNTPVFQEAFGRIPEIRLKTAVPGVEYTFRTNNTHKGFIERMQSAFGCVEKINFNTVPLKTLNIDAGDMNIPLESMIYKEDLQVNSAGKMEGPYDDIELEVKQDFDGYFENLVKQAIDVKKSKGEKFRWKKIIITAGPYRDYDMHGKRTPEGDLNIDFYSAVRNGFGSGQATVENILTML